MLGKEQTLEIIIDEFSWRIVITLDFIDDYFHFFLQLCLWIGAVEDDVHQQGKSTMKVLAQEGGIVNGFFLTRIGVEVAAYTFYPVENLCGRKMLCTLERHVLHQMGHTAFAVQLMTSASSNGYAGINDIGRRRGKNNTKGVHQKSLKSSLWISRMATHSISMSQVGRQTGARVMT